MFILHNGKNYRVPTSRDKLNITIIDSFLKWKIVILYNIVIFLTLKRSN